MNELQQYKIPLIFGAIGLVLAVLFVTIGFQNIADSTPNRFGFCVRIVSPTYRYHRRIFNQQ